MQYMVSCQGPSTIHLLALLEQHFLELSCNKFASNVTEKAIKNNHSNFNERIVRRILDSQEYPYPHTATSPLLSTSSATM